MSHHSLEYASCVRCFPGESVGGDAAFIKPLDEGYLFAIVDVLGHGPEAHKLVPVIEEYLLRFGSFDVVTVAKNLHQHLQRTRGAAIGLCAIDAEASRAVYVGVGNTVLRQFGHLEARFVSQDGVIGQNMRTPMLQHVALKAGDFLVLYTDGVSDRFGLQEYPSIAQHSVETVAANIVQRFGKGHDDASCLAIKCQSASA